MTFSKFSLVHLKSESFFFSIHFYFFHVSWILVGGQVTGFGRGSERRGTGQKTRVRGPVWPLTVTPMTHGLNGDTWGSLLHLSQHQFVPLFPSLSFFTLTLTKINKHTHTQEKTEGIRYGHLLTTGSIKFFFFLKYIFTFLTLFP